MRLKYYGLSLLLLLSSTLVLADNRQSINEQRSVSSNERITLDVQRGDVKIIPAKGNQFTVSGKLDERSEGVELESAGGFTRFVVKMPRQLNENNSDKAWKSELVFEVPAGSELEFKGVNVDVDVSGISGSSQINTVNGDIEAKQLSNNVELSTVNGKIDTSDLQGHLRLKTINGKISDKNSGGRLFAESINGKIELESKPDELMVTVVNAEVELELNGTRQLEVSSVNGTVEIELKNQNAPRIKGSTVNGRYELKLPATLDASVSLKTTAGGNIKNDLTDDKPSRAKYGPATNLQFNIGQGTGSIDITSVGGQLQLKKN